MPSVEFVTLPAPDRNDGEGSRLWAIMAADRALLSGRVARWIVEPVVAAWAPTAARARRVAAPVTTWTGRRPTMRSASGR